MSGYECGYYLDVSFSKDSEIEKRKVGEEIYLFSSLFLAACTSGCDIAYLATRRSVSAHSRWSTR